MKRALTALPAFLASGAAALPVLTCPLCWPLYSGLLSAIGLGFVNYTPYLLPATVVLLVIALAALAWRARERRGYWPFYTGFAGACLLLAGKFWLAMPVLYYSGICILLGASLWNIWPVRNQNCKACDQ